MSLVERVPVFGLELEADLAGFAGVVVDGDGDGDAVALGERDRQIEIDEEVLEDLEARGGGAERARRGGGEHGHAPGGDGVGDGDGDVGVAVAVGDDFRIDVERLGKVGADMRCSLLRYRLEHHGESPSLHGLGGEALLFP